MTISEEPIYTKVVPIRMELLNQKGSSSSFNLTLTVEALGSINQNSRHGSEPAANFLGNKQQSYFEKSYDANKSGYLIKLTDENDLRFLYNCLITTQEYEVIKKEQNLLVSFEEFIKNFVSLVDKTSCDLGSAGSQPLSNSGRFCIIFKELTSALNAAGHQYKREDLVNDLPMRLTGNESDDSSLYELSIVEINTFKQIVHLSLVFRRASAAGLVDYLAHLVYSYRDTVRRQDDLLNSVKSGGQKQFSELQLKYSALMSELETSRLRYQDLETRCSNNLADYQNSRKLLETELQLLKRNLSDAEKIKREQDQEISLLKDKNFKLSRESESLEREIRDRYKPQIDQMQTKLDNVQHSLVEAQNQLFNYKQNSSQVQINYDALQSNYAQLEMKYNQAISMNSDLKAENKEIQGEINKANEIIAKMQNEIRLFKDRMKQKNLVVQEQEKKVEEVSNNLAESNSKISSLESDLLKWRTKYDELKVSHDALQKQVKDNQQVIDYLHKQLSEKKSNNSSAINGITSGMASLNATGSTSARPFVEYRRAPLFSNTAGTAASNIQTSVKQPNVKSSYF
ncbi:hypothetical protein MP638_000548 [Amoeboaphelidium occidentale]|nr:hypothetical protein MP638_000548 [Amoeboaphelidium occidentale]